uniref:Uncharacterized protein n=1 Tax=Romanomermis culicivorax TaxID=13658 RepID=A0A915IBD6_ROMCU
MIADSDSSAVVDDEDFGDFEESVAPIAESVAAVSVDKLATSLSAPDIQEIKILEDLDDLFDTIETILNETLGDESSHDGKEDCGQLLLNELLHNQGVNKETFVLWNSLKIIEESVALKFTYLKSGMFKTYAKSLNLDVSLAKSHRRNVPRFASHFNPLETLTPEKLPITLNSDDLDVLESAASCSSFASKNVARNTNDVKPVVNLDLNYFVSNDHSLSSIDSIASPPAQSSPVLNQTTTNGGTLLDKNANKLTNPMLPKFEIATVQSEALKLAEKLPDLNFMLSPVLMFPIKENYADTATTNNIGTNSDNTFVNKQNI